MVKLDSKEVLLRFQNAHGNRFDYSKFVYQGVDTPSIIICKEHGEFLQSSYNHARGAGCVKCSYSNYKGSWTYSNWEKSAQTSKNFNGYKIYFLALENQEERFFKIGRTFLPINLRLGKNIPYKHHVLVEIDCDNAKECCERENKIHNQLRSFKYKPKIKFNGYNECYRLKNTKEDVRILIELFNLEREREKQ